MNWEIGDQSNNLRIEDASWATASPDNPYCCRLILYSSGHARLLIWSIFFPECIQTHCIVYSSPLEVIFKKNNRHDTSDSEVEVRADTWFIMFNTMFIGATICRIKESCLMEKKEKKIIGIFGVWSLQAIQSINGPNRPWNEWIYVLTMPAYVCNQQNMRKNATEPWCSKPKSYIYSQANCGQKQQMQ